MLYADSEARNLQWSLRSCALSEYKAFGKTAALRLLIVGGAKSGRSALAAPAAGCSFRLMYVTALCVADRSQTLPHVRRMATF